MRGKKIGVSRLIRVMMTAIKLRCPALSLIHTKSRRLYLALAAIIFCSGLSGAETGSNLLLITIDTLRPDRLSCYAEGASPTPNIDALAKTGILFERAFAHNPLTLPSHANILLGTTPLHHGVHENALAVVPPEPTTLAEFLKERGYATAAFIGAFSLDSRFGLAQGFDVYDDSFPLKSARVFVMPERSADQVVTAALDWLVDQDSPWFAWVHIWDPHAPYLPPEPFRSRFRQDPYSGEVGFTDSQLGRVFSFLDANHLRENTVTVLTGDHGEAFGEHGETSHGYFAYNSTLWIPLIVSGPGISPGRVKEAVGHIDLFPTICDLLEKEKPGFLQGASLVPLLKGGKIKSRPIYFESLEPAYHYGWAPLRGFIDNNMKYIDSPIPEIYDLQADFSESRNLIRPDTGADNRKRLESLMAALQKDPPPAPPRQINRRALEKLRSLGYISSPVKQGRSRYGPEDDLKALLNLQQKQMQALQLFEEGSGRESIRLLREVILERSDFGKSYVLLSKILTEMGTIDQALGVLQAGFEKNPENFELVSEYGILLVQSGGLDQGKKILRDALDLVDFDPNVWTYLGIANTRSGDISQAQTCYQKALELDPNDPFIQVNLGVHYFTMFIRDRSRNNYQQASEAYKKAIQLDPEMASAYNGLAGVYKTAGQVDAAVALWEKAVELEPDFELPLYNLGLSWLEKDDKLKALGYLEKYRKLRQGRMSPREQREIDELISQCRRD